MAKILYVMGVKIPDEVRAEKVCRALIKNGHEVTVLSRWFDGAAEREIYQGIIIRRVGKNIPFWQSNPLSINPFWKKAIFNAAKETQAELIITREMLIAEASANVGRTLAIPTLIDMAENYPGAMRGWKKYQSRLILRLLVNNVKVPDLIEKRAVQASDGIIIVCDEQIDRLHHEYGIEKENMVVVQNTPELELFEKVTKTCSMPPKVFAHHGYFTLDRCLETLALGFIKASSDYSDIQLLLAGIGETYNDVRAIADMSAVSNRIFLKGEFKLTSRAELYNQVDVGIMPYAADENFNFTIPNKLFDYMACGKPVIVSEAIPMKRIVEETGAGIVADCSTPAKIAKAIQQMIDSDVAAMSEKGRIATEKKYNWAVDSERLCKFVRKFIA
ncbi:MAG: glycosyltransferase family 4 protein [Ignavibacteria bacterium]|nr:glycosyltransferase family 4 protein [Ignavibacteria bacterium]